MDSTTTVMALVMRAQLGVADNQLGVWGAQKVVVDCQTTPTGCGSLLNQITVRSMGTADDLPGDLLIAIATASLVRSTKPSLSVMTALMRLRSDQAQSQRSLKHVHREYKPNRDHIYLEKASGGTDDYSE